MQPNGFWVFNPRFMVQKSGVEMRNTGWSLGLKSSGLKCLVIFQKGSPLVPFFKHAYGKLRQTGTLARIKQKWEKKGISGNCGSNQLRPISFNKIASVIVLLLLGMCIAFLISVIEIFCKRRAEAKMIEEAFSNSIKS